MTVPAITSLYAFCFTLLFLWANWRLYRFSKTLRVPYRHRPEIVGETPWLVVLLLIGELAGLSIWLLHGTAILAFLTRARHIQVFVRNLGKWQDQGGVTSLIFWMLIGFLAAVLVVQFVLLHGLFMAE